MGRRENNELIMPGIRELRQQQVSAAPQSSGALGTILIGVAAFAIGAMGIAAWKYLPSPKAPKVAAVTEQAAPVFGGNRIGRAATAPLLRTCTSSSSSFEGFGNGNGEMIYQVLTAAGTMQRFAPLIGAETGDSAQLTDYWREIADCIYRQNSWNLCDVDNRAIAVEAASAFIRGAGRLAANPPQARGAQRILSETAGARQRVLDALRSRLRSGHLIAADFGPLAPAEIKSLLADVKPTANGCAKN